MKLFLVLLLLVGGYYIGLMQMSSLAVNQLGAIQQDYAGVANASAQWQQGNTAVSLDPRH